MSHDAALFFVKKETGGYIRANLRSLAWFYRIKDGLVAGGL
jgi:hypothetical protein